MAVRFLVLETEAHGADGVEQSLAAAGHDVVRCHAADAAVIPCAAMQADGCPLDGTSVDAAITVRSQVLTEPAAREDGASCALRHHVPLVVTGRTDGNPFATYAAAEVDTADAVAACEQVGRAPSQALSAAATKELDSLLDRHGLGGRSGTVTVRRSEGDLLATVRVTGSAQALSGAAAVRIAGALRHADPYAGRIDVCIEES